MTFTRTLTRSCLCTGVLAFAASCGWAADQAAAASDANPETASVVGTVQALDPAKHQFTLREDCCDDSADYRAYFRNGNPAAMLDRISKLTIGEHLKITYTEHEGRRVLTLEDVPAANAK